MHGLRKEFAQEVYDIERIAGASRTDAGDTVQEQLGHGKGRNERLQNTYMPCGITPQGLEKKNELGLDRPSSSLTLYHCQQGIQVLFTINDSFFYSFS